MAKYFQNLPIEERPEMIISSPYYRCVQTSLPTAEGLGLELMIEPGELMTVERDTMVGRSTK